MAIYPDNIWYTECTPVRIEAIIQQHLIEGLPLDCGRIDPATGCHEGGCPNQSLKHENEGRPTLVPLRSQRG